MKIPELESRLPGFACDEDPTEDLLTVRHKCCGHEAVYNAIAVSPEIVIQDALAHRKECELQEAT